MTPRFEPPADGTAWFCVVGSPIAHSRSPQIHAAFAAQRGIALVYQRVEVAAGGLAAAVAEFRRLGGRGMNVTVPLKEEAFALAARPSARATAAQAANTLWFDPAHGIAADNTDGVGLVRDLVDNHGVSLAGAHLLLLGAGGAARGVLPELLAARPASLTLTNRTAARAEAVARSAAAAGRVELLEWGALPPRPPGIVINATALSLSGELPPLPRAAIGPDCVCYDMMYGSGPTVFVAWAREAGARCALDGLGMLVEQAAAAFEIWHGVMPQTRPVIEALRSA